MTGDAHVDRHGQQSVTDREAFGTSRELRMTTLTAIREYLGTTFPQSNGIVEQVGDRSATVRQPVGINELRPGERCRDPS